MFEGTVPAVTDPADRQLLTRQLVVDSARDIIVAGGLEALSLRGLAGQLGVTAPALYAHVRDKRDILQAIAEAEFAVLVARFRAVATADPVERIKGQNRAYVEHACDRPQLFRVMFLFAPEVPRADPPDGFTLAASTEAFTTAAAAVGDAIAVGVIVADDPLLVTLALWAGVHGVAMILQLELGLPHALEDALVDEVTDRILAGYRR